MKTIRATILLTLILSCSYNFSIASDTLFLIFKPSAKNQYITKDINKCYDSLLNNKKYCSITKKYWFKYNVTDSVKKIEYQFVFTRIQMIDSNNTKPSEVSSKTAYKALQKKYNTIGNKRSSEAKKIKNEINGFRVSSLYNEINLKKSVDEIGAKNIIYLSKIETIEQLVTIETRIQKNKVFLVDLSDSKKNGNLIAYKVSGIQLSPVKGTNLKF